MLAMFPVQTESEHLHVNDLGITFLQDNDAINNIKVIILFL